jgi:hypothetical protein
MILECKVSKIGKGKKSETCGFEIWDFLPRIHEFSFKSLRLFIRINPNNIE